MSSSASDPIDNPTPPAEDDWDALVEKENQTPANIRLNRIKAIDVTIDSLKQYITLSTVSIAGLLAFYNGNGKGGNYNLFITAIVLLLLTALTSVFTINTYINQLHYCITNTRAKLSRISNFLAIIFFIAGIITAAIFISTALNNLPPNSPPTSSGLKIQKNGLTIQVDDSYKAKLNIRIDSLHNIITIEQRP